MANAAPIVLLHDDQENISDQRSQIDRLGASVIFRGNPHGNNVIGIRVRVPRDSRQLARFAALSAGALILALSRVHPACGRAVLNFPPSDFEIVSSESGQLVGHGHYAIDQMATSLVLRGENRYLDGEYDTEEEKLTIAAAGERPQLSSFRHDFFNADGSPSVEARLDMRTGLGVCGKAQEGKLEFARKRFEIPADTYAGASVLLPIQELAAEGDRTRTIKLHVFNCAPAPKLIAVDVKLESGQRPWVEYPGELEKIDIKANFGFWTLVVQPFIPKLAAWFDPSQDMLLVGAQLQRYYKGAKITLVRKRQATISRAPTVAGAPPP